jgi:3-oxoacyl-[acyl-carrier protein] reductase
MNAIITGATKGIGRAIAEKLAKEGFDLAICSRNNDDLKTTVEELSSAYGIKVHTLQTDCGNKKEILKFADLALNKFDKIHILVNNAALYNESTIMQEENGNLEQMIETNLYGPYYLSKKIAEQMIQQQYGHIFNISSIAGIGPYPQASSYSVSKFALMGLNKNLREELRKYNIKVTAIIPGSTLTDSWKNVSVPESWFVSPHDIASALYNAFTMTGGACVDEITIRPTLGMI